MCETTEFQVPLNIYEEDLNEETTRDLSCQGLDSVPVIKNKLLSVLYLQDNTISTLPDDFFPSLPSLMWLDLRDNRLTMLPKTILHHPNLTHLLLQNNNITSLPDELGTVLTLKVLQLNGNPLTYPPNDVTNAGVSKILKFLNDKYIEHMCASQSDFSEYSTGTSGNFSENTYNQEARSYNSVIDGEKVKNKTLSVQFSEKDLDDSEDESYYSKIKGKCPKLSKIRAKIPKYYQSSKYVQPLFADNKETFEKKIKQTFLKEAAIKKQKDLLATREKIIQDKKNIELLKQWRKDYRNWQLSNRDGTYKLEPKNFPYDTSPEYMTLLTREDIEKDLPDKYKKKLVRRPKPTVPRKNANDVHLAMKIKKLFENLEAIDLKRGEMTPRTEQKVLLNEIQKITEIKQKLMELSAANVRSVLSD